MAFWQNSDGLGVKLGVTEAVTLDTTKFPAGEYSGVDGPNRITEVAFNLVGLSTSTQLILNDDAIIPKHRIEQVVLEVETAATSGGSATLDFGLSRTDRTTELDYDGYAAAVALATINTAGKKLTLFNGVTGAGALIGTTTTNPGLLVAKAGTAVFTAGRIRARIYWYPL